MTTTNSKRIEWTNSRGQQVKATVEIITERTLSADGDMITVPCCEWHESVTLDGCYQGSDIAPMAPVTSGGVTATARCGRVGIPVEQMARIESARAELRSSDVWAAHLATAARNLADRIEYDKACARINCAMTLGGKTY